MMHARPVLPALLAVLLLASTPAAAADCTEVDPCVLRVTLDDAGVWFDAPGDRDTEVLQHRWYLLDVLNQFDGEHVLTLGNQTFPAPGYDGDGPRSRHGPVPFPDAGDLTLHDATARATATVHVQAAEPPEGPAEPPADPPGGDGDSDGGGGDPGQEQAGDPHDPPERRKNVPGPSPLPLAAAIALAALAVRTRR